MWNRGSSTDIRLRTSELKPKNELALHSQASRLYPHVGHIYCMCMYASTFLCNHLNDILPVWQRFYHLFGYRLQLCIDGVFVPLELIFVCSLNRTPNAQSAILHCTTVCSIMLHRTHPMQTPGYRALKRMPSPTTPTQMR